MHGDLTKIADLDETD